MKKKLAIPFGVIVLGILSVLGMWDGCKKKVPPPLIVNNDLYVADELEVDGQVYDGVEIWVNGKMYGKGSLEVTYPEGKNPEAHIEGDIKFPVTTKIVEKVVEKEVVVYKELDEKPYTIVPNTVPRKIINLAPGDKYKFIFKNEGK